MKKISILILATILIPLSANSFERIISLKPNITSILLALGAKNQIVGITRYCSWPDNNIPLKVADYLGPKSEAVASLNPDLIISSKENSLKAPIDNLKNLGFNVKLFSFDRIDQIASSVKQIGKLTGHKARGLYFAKAIQELSKTSKEKNKPTTLLIVGTRPLVAAGDNTYLNDLLKHEGLKNIAPERGNYPRIGPEELSILKPDIIIDITPNGISSEILPKKTCYKLLKSNDFQIPGPELLNAATQLSMIKKECSERN